MNNVSVAEALEMLTSVSGASDIDSDAKLGTLGLDSLEMVEWLSMLERKIGAQFKLDELDFEELNVLSMNDVLAALRNALAGSSKP